MQSTTQLLAKDASEAVNRAHRGVDENGGWAVVPLCPEGVKQRDVAQGLKELGLTGTRMGTDNTRTLFVVRGDDPPPLLFRHLSPETRNCLATHTEVRTVFHERDGDLFVALPGVDADRWLDLLSRLFYELGGEKRFLDLHRMTVTRVGTVLAASDAMAEWSHLPEPSPKDGKPEWPVYAVRGCKAKGGTICQAANDGRCFVSVDMSAANFQVLRNFGIISEPSWAALVSRPDVAFSPRSAEYAAQAKGLRMMALSTPVLRPNLQRARWSRVVLQAFDTIVEAGHADGYHDLAAFNSDEVLIHADDEDDATAKADDIAALLKCEMPEWEFKCAAFVLEQCDAGFRCKCLHTNRVTHKRVSFAHMQQAVAAWAPLLPHRRRAAPPPWPDSRCIAALNDAERNVCDRAMLEIVAANYSGVPRRSVLDMLGGATQRANDLYKHLLEEFGRGILVETEDARVLAVWHRRARIWPPTMPPEVRLVRTSEECRIAVEHLVRSHAVVAFDCEGSIPSDGRVELSLIQVSGDDGIVHIFDMLSPEAPWFDLHPLFDNPAITKVAHDGRGDLAVLFLRNGLRVRGFVDTQIAYSIARKIHRSVSLNAFLADFPYRNDDGTTFATCVNEHKTAISKQMSRDRWCWHRPLTSRMVSYASCDVKHVVHAYECLMMEMDVDKRELVLALSAQRAQEAASSPKINDY